MSFKTNKTKITGTAQSVPAGLAISGAVSIMITTIISAMLANLLHTERITWEAAGYWIMFMILLAAFLGAKCAFAVVKRQRLAVSIMAGFLYWGILLSVTALFFGGQYESVPQTAALIAAGSGAGALLHIPKKEFTNAKRSKHYR